jgi:hypothetical protein
MLIVATPKCDTIADLSVAVRKPGLKHIALLVGTAVSSDKDHVCAPGRR